jgi:hypothetical protein
MTIGIIIQRLKEEKRPLILVSGIFQEGSCILQVVWWFAKKDAAGVHAFFCTNGGSFDRLQKLGIISNVR